MKDPKFLKYPDGRYIGLTGETMKGVTSIVVGFTGPSPSEVVEVAEAVGRLPSEIVGGEDLPDEWKDAFHAHGFDFEVEEDEGCTAAQQRIAELELDCVKYKARISNAVPVEPGIFWILTTIAAVTMIAIMHLARNG